MLRLISDADVHGHIVRGVRGRNPGIDLIRVHEVGLRTARDPVILEWAAVENRIVISQDRSSMIGFARARVAAGFPMPGLFVLRPRTTVAQAIELSCWLTLAASKTSGKTASSFCRCKLAP